MNGLGNISDPDTATARAIGLANAYQHTNDRALLEQAVVYFRAAVAGAPADHPDRCMYLYNLGGMLLELFKCTQNLGTLRDAVQVSRAAVAAASADHTDRPTYLSSLGSALLTLFQWTDDEAVLAEAVRVGRTATAEAPADHPDRAAILNSLGIILKALSERTGDPGLGALKEAAGVLRVASAAAAATAYEDHAAILSNLGAALQRLFEHTGDQGLLLEGIEVLRAAVAATPEGHSQRAGYSNNLGAVLQTAFERTGDRRLLAEAVESYRAAVGAAAPEHADRAMYLSNLGNALRVQFEFDGDRGVLAEAVDVAKAAVSATSAGHPDLARHLSNLGAVLGGQYRRTGEMGILSASADAIKAALAAAAPDHPARSTYLHNLGLTRREQYRRTGELDVLLEAAQAGRKAVSAVHAGHSERPVYLNDLGLTLQVLYDRTLVQDALDEAVQVGREAVAAAPADDPSRALFLSNLGISLQILFDHTGKREALMEALSVERAAVAGTAVDHPLRAGYLGNLATSLQTLYKHTGRRHVLMEGVEYARAAVAAAPEDRPDRASLVHNLGLALQTLFELTGRRSVLAEARCCHLQAAHLAAGETYIRIQAYRQFAHLALRAGLIQEALPAIEAAIDLAETLAPGTLTRNDRAFQLGRLDNLPGEAATVALAAGEPARAVELLERTRGILAADTVGIRGPDQTRLRASAPDLADELERMRDRLDILDHPHRALDPALGAGDTRLGAAQDVSNADRHLAGERAEAHAARRLLLERIRSLPGFADFLQPPSAAALAAQAREGPIIFVIAGHTRSAALILTDGPDPVQTVPLTGLTHADAYANANRLLNARRSVGFRERDATSGAPGQSAILAVLAWLWDTIAEPVLTHLGHTGAPRGDRPWPRVWWCPIGVLATLPLHAAGHHDPLSDESSTPRAVLDLAISSYTPTVQALVHARAARSVPHAASTLIVPVPDFPGAPLPGVTEEATSIAALIPGARLLERPTRAAVLKSLPEHRIAHFACHGKADWAEPSRSSLILADHHTEPLTLADVTALNLTADLAYLSACSTSVTAPRLADESLHMTAAFQLAGYRNVIGTLWSVNDKAAARIATDFYAHLTAQGTGAPQTDHSARALHHAVRALRAHHPDTPTLWSAHTHTGP